MPQITIQAVLLSGPESGESDSPSTSSRHHTFGAANGALAFVPLWIIYYLNVSKNPVTVSSDLRRE